MYWREGDFWPQNKHHSLGANVSFLLLGWIFGSLAGIFSFFFPFFFFLADQKRTGHFTSLLSAEILYAVWMIWEITAWANLIRFEQCSLSSVAFFFFFLFFSAGAKSALVHVNTGRLALGEANAGAKWSVKCSPWVAGLWLLLLLWESLILSLARLLLIALIEKVTYIWERLLVDQQNSWRTCRGREGWWNEWGRNLERREKKIWVAWLSCLNILDKAWTFLKLFKVIFTVVLWLYTLGFMDPIRQQGATKVNLTIGFIKGGGRGRKVEMIK